MTGDITQSIISATAGLTGVVVGGLLTWIREARRDHKLQVKEAHYLAIRIVCALDELADKSVSVVADDGLEDQYGYRSHDVETPVDIAFPTDVHWKSISYGLTYQILAIKARLSEADRAIRATADTASPPDYHEYTEERQERFAKIGIDIIKITNLLRERYGIPYRDEGNWNSFQYLSDKLSKIRGRQEARAEFNRQMFAKFQE